MAFKAYRISHGHTPTSASPFLSPSSEYAMLTDLLSVPEPTTCALAVGLSPWLLHTSLLQLFHRLAPPCHLGLSSNDTMPQKSSLNAWSEIPFSHYVLIHFLWFSLHSSPSEIILLIYLAVSFSSNTVSLRTGTMSSSPVISSAHWVNDLVL